MLMAKFAMWNEAWDDALYALNLLEETYGEFNEGYFPLEDVKWSIKNPDESIFEIEHAWDANGVKFYGGIASLMCPKCSGEGMYDGVYMKDLSQTGSNATSIRATNHYALFSSADN